MTKEEFVKKTFIELDSDYLSPAASYRVLTERLIKDSSVDQDLKSLIENLNKEHIKVLQNLENAIFELCD